MSPQPQAPAIRLTPRVKISPDGYLLDISVVHDRLTEDDIIKFSKLKNGSKKDTTNFAKDLCRAIQHDLGHRIRSKPSSWGIVTIGSSKFLGLEVATRLGIDHGHLWVEGESLIRKNNYYESSTERERLDIQERNFFYFERRRQFKCTHVILIDDLLNTGYTLSKGKLVLERAGFFVDAIYVLYSIYGSPDATQEKNLNLAFQKSFGLDGLLRLVNEEGVHFTRHLLKNVLYERSSRRKTLRTLTSKNQAQIAYRGAAYVLGKAFRILIIKARRQLSAAAPNDLI